MQNVRSFLFKPVFKRQKNTPAIRNASTPKIKTTAANPADSAYLIFTVAPTRTNSIISETTHSLLNLTDKRSATLFRFFWSVIPTAITAINEANGITSASWSILQCDQNKRNTQKDHHLGRIPDMYLFKKLCHQIPDSHSDNNPQRNGNRNVHKAFYRYRIPLCKTSERCK